MSEGQWYGGTKSGRLPTPVVRVSNLSRVVKLSALTKRHSRTPARQLLVSHITGDVKYYFTHYERAALWSRFECLAHSLQKGTPSTTSTKYIGMDVHKESISIAVLNFTGKVVMECLIETKASTILQFIHGLRGDLQVTFEEGTWAAWLHDLLRPQVSEVVVCNPRKIALLKDGSKSDRIVHASWPNSCT
jgi:hypothetical protein